MKNIITILMLLVSVLNFGQSGYKTNSGINYKVGDTLEIGKPIIIANGPIVGVNSHWKTLYKMNGKNCSNSNLTNKIAIINKIETIDGITLFYFKLFKTNFYVKIEEALAKGEIVSKYETKLISSLEPDKYDKLKKLKEIYDLGAITKEEYEVEKRKLLGN